MHIMYEITTVICLVISVVEAGNCPIGLLSGCECSSNAVNCTGRELTTLPENMIFDLGHTFFYFEDNLLTEIRANYFVNLIDMQHLDLGQNRISRIESKSLDANTKLTTIDLSHNNLSFLPVHIFAKLSQLSFVYLDNNKLTRIEEKHFFPLTNLIDVRLEDNALTYVGRNSFRNSPKLHQLYLENNKLEIPEAEWFTAFNNVEEGYEVYLDGNEWSCDCRMKEFFLWGSKHPWFMKHDGEGVSVPRCHFPDELRGISLAKIANVDLLKCKNVTMTSQTRDIGIKTVEGTEVKLHCGAEGYPLPKVSIEDKYGNTVTESLGTTTYWIHPVMSQHSGLYSCIASGFNESGQTMSVSMKIRLTVFKSAGSIVTIILVSLALVGIVLGAGVWLYKTKLAKRIAYGRLPNSSVYYERDNVTASAQSNIDSMRYPQTAPAVVENPYDETESEDDDKIVEYAKEGKDTEFLV